MVAALHRAAWGDFKVKFFRLKAKSAQEEQEEESSIF